MYVGYEQKLKKYAEFWEKIGGRNQNLPAPLLCTFFFFLPSFVLFPYPFFSLSLLISCDFSASLVPFILCFKTFYLLPSPSATVWLSPEEKQPGGVPVIRINPHFGGEQLVALKVTGVTIAWSYAGLRQFWQKRKKLSWLICIHSHSWGYQGWICPRTFYIHWSAYLNYENLKWSSCSSGSVDRQPLLLPIHTPSTPQVLILHSKDVKWFEVSNAHQQGESTDCCNSIQRCVTVNLFSALSSLLVSDGKMDPEVYKNDMIEYGTFFLIKT